jgi:hypothetical protein
VAIDIAATRSEDAVDAQIAEAKGAVDETIGTASKSFAKSTSFVTGEQSVGEVAVDTAVDDLQDKVGMKAAEIDEKLQRKLCGVGENGANRAKVVFILLTGLLALVEAVMITTSTKRSVYIDVAFALETAGQKEILEVFNASAFLPSCISDAPGIGGYANLPPPPPPLPPSPPPLSSPVSPPMPPSPNAPPSTPPWTESDAAISALTSSQSLTNLWFSDTEESLCANDRLFSGEATVEEDCGKEPEFCGACDLVGFALPDSLKPKGWEKPAWCQKTCPEGDPQKLEESRQWEKSWEEWKKCQSYVSLYFDTELNLPIGTFAVRSAMRGLANFFTMTLFISAVCYTGARISLHYLTMRGSKLCDCCPGCVRSCLLAFLKKGGPFALNSLMIINTKMGWNEGGEDGTPGHVYGYSLGFGQLELIFFFINVIFMIVSILFALLIFIAPTCLAAIVQLCCKCCGGKTRALQKVKKCGRGYVVMALYLLSFWGFLTTFITAMLKYYREVGLDIPSSPTVALQAFPLVDLFMTLLMFPPNIAIQLGSKITFVKLVGAIRLAKVASVCFPIGIDVFLQVLEWKYAGPPSKCCKACCPCCGRGDLPKKGSIEMVDIEGGSVAGDIRAANSAIAGQDVGFSNAKEKKQASSAENEESKQGLQERAAHALEGAQERGLDSAGGLQESLGEDAAAIEESTSALAEKAKLAASETASVDAPQRLEEELQKAGAQVAARSSGELGALQDMAPQDGREAMAMAKAEVARRLEKSEAKADKEQKKAEAKQGEGEAEGEGGASGRVSKGGADSQRA